LTIVNECLPRSRRYFAILLPLLFLTASCNTDPNYAKQQYLNSGNKYYDRGRFKEALIMYRKALSKDPKFGEAYFRLGRTYSKLGQNASLVGVLRRAAELLPKGTPHWNEAALTLGELLVQGAIALDVPGKNKPLMDEVNQLLAVLDSKAPNSFEDYRLHADILRADAASALNRQDRELARQKLEESITYLRKSLQVRPNDLDATVELGRSLTLDAKPAEAEQLYRQLLDHDKTVALAYTELFRIYMSEKRTSEAQEILRRGIASLPENFSLRTLLAGFYYTQNNRSEMARALADPEADIKKFPQAYLTAGDFYVRIQDFDTAFKHYQEGELKDPSRKQEYEKREIELLLRQGKNDQAYAKTQEMLKADPNDLDARAIKANFMLNRGEVSQAIGELQTVVTAKPDNFVAHFNLGRAYAAHGESSQAMQQYREAFRLRPDYVVARISLAETNLKVGDFDSALQTAQEAEKYSPGNPDARLLQAMALMHLDRNDEARKIFDDLLAKHPRFPEAELQYGMLDSHEKKYDAARAKFQQAYQTNSADLRPLIGESETYLAEKQPAKALALLKTESDTHPARTDIALEYARLQARTGQLDPALNGYQSLVEKFKQNPRQLAQTYAAMGELYVQKGDLTQALAFLEKAKALQPSSIPLLNFLAETEAHAGRSKEAQDAYRAVLALDANNPQALNNLAYAIAETGTNLDEALTMASKAKQQLPNVDQVSDTLGWIYIKKRMSDSATDVFSALVAKSPNNPTYHYHYCLALYIKGDKAGAQRECTAALSKNPGKTEADEVRQLMARLN
jgi:tetratricopeptide (TPR) repeat protein